MSRSVPYLSEYRAAKPSRSAAINASLPYPVIDTDVHTTEFTPLIEDYIAQYGGSKVVDEFREGTDRGYAFGVHNWYKLTPTERHAHRSVRPAWWGLPSKNALDLATASLPHLLHERLGDLGTDFAILYPNVTVFAVLIRKEETRRAVVRAINHYHADIYKPYADRLTPVAAIPLFTPQEGIEEAEFAVKTLGFKTILIPGALRRPIQSIAEKYPPKYHAEVAYHGSWIDTFGIDSEYDYDPFWAKVVELGVAPTTHSGGMGWTARSSTSNYVFNHIGHFAEASHVLAKSLFFGGVTKRFPKLRVGFLEGGAGWGAQLYADLVGHWEKRGARQVQNYNPDLLDRNLLASLVREHGGDLIRDKQLDDDALVNAITTGTNGTFRQPQAPGTTDEFSLAGIESIEDIRDRYVPNFFFGSEADDGTVAYAFNSKVNPLGTKVNAFWASDSGHWDVPDLTEVLAQTWDHVQHGRITEEDFRDLVFANPYKFYTDVNPDFFKGTAVEAKLGKRKAA